MCGNISILLVVGSAILIAFYGGKFANRFHFPMVIGYVIIGILLGKSFLNLLNSEIINNTRLINDLALGIIAFLIGGELNFYRLKTLGKNIFFITIFETLGAFLLVTFFSYLLILLQDFRLCIALLSCCLQEFLEPVYLLLLFSKYIS